MRRADALRGEGTTGQRLTGMFTGLRLVIVALSAVGLITTSAALELFRFGEIASALNTDISAATARQDAVASVTRELTAVAQVDTPTGRAALAAAVEEAAPLLGDGAVVAELRRAVAGEVPVGRVRAQLDAIGEATAAKLESGIAMWDRASASVSQLVALSLASIVVLLFTVVLRTLAYLSARDRTEAQLRAATAEAEAANAAKTDFLATMSHEIRTPLTAIRGYSDLLAAGRLDAVQRDQLDRLRDANGTLAMLIDDLLDLSKIEAGHFDLHEGVIDLAALVDRVLALVEPAARAKGLELTRSLDPDVPSFVTGDGGRVLQVLLNLTGNAVKFTEKGGVAVAITREGDTIGFAVTDTGIGIGAQDIPKLFKRFSQLDSSLSRAHSGTGLGLAISRGLVQRMGGTIGVESTMGVGTTFRVTLPLPAAPALAPAVAETGDTATPALHGSGGQVSGGRVSGARILVVEDSPQNQDLIKAVLRRDGHLCSAAFDGAEGLALASTGLYDLVIMDMQMPRMDGIAATAAIRALPAPQGRVPILAVSANALSHQVAAMRNAGADAHLSKPFGIDDLARSVAGLLGNLADEAEAGTAGAIMAGSAGNGLDEAVTAEGVPDEAALDLTALDDLVALLGRDWVRTRLVAVMSGLDWTRADLAPADLLPSDLTPADLRRHAHRLVSESGQLGLTRLGEAAARLEEAIDAGRDLAECRAALLRAAGASAAVLPGLLARLDRA